MRKRRSKRLATRGRGRGIPAATAPSTDEGEAAASDDATDMAGTSSANESYEVVDELPPDQVEDAQFSVDAEEMSRDLQNYEMIGDLAVDINMSDFITVDEVIGMIGEEGGNREKKDGGKSGDASRKSGAGRSDANEKGSSDEVGISRDLSTPPCDVEDEDDPFEMSTGFKVVDSIEDEDASGPSALQAEIESMNEQLKKENENTAQESPVVTPELCQQMTSNELSKENVTPDTPSVKNVEDVSVTENANEWVVLDQDNDSESKHENVNAENLIDTNTNAETAISSDSQLGSIPDCSKTEERAINSNKTIETTFDEAKSNLKNSENETIKDKDLRESSAAECKISEESAELKIDTKDDVDALVLDSQKTDTSQIYIEKENASVSDSLNIKSDSSQSPEPSTKLFTEPEPDATANIPKDNFLTPESVTPKTEKSIPNDTLSKLDIPLKLEGADSVDNIVYNIDHLLDTKGDKTLTDTSGVLSVTGLNPTDGTISEQDTDRETASVAEIEKSLVKDADVDSVMSLHIEKTSQGVDGGIDVGSVAIDTESNIPNAINDKTNLDMSPSAGLDLDSKCVSTSGLDFKSTSGELATVTKRSSAERRDFAGMENSKVSQPDSSEMESNNTTLEVSRDIESDSQSKVIMDSELQPQMHETSMDVDVDTEKNIQSVSENEKDSSGNAQMSRDVVMEVDAVNNSESPSESKMGTADNEVDSGGKPNSELKSESEKVKQMEVSDKNSPAVIPDIQGDSSSQNETQDSGMHVDKNQSIPQDINTETKTIKGATVVGAETKEGSSDVVTDVKDGATATDQKTDGENKDGNTSVTDETKELTEKKEVKESGAEDKPGENVPKKPKKKDLPLVGDDQLCPSCGELYSIPVLLACSHFLCRDKCAKKIVGFGVTLKCPQCSQNHFIKWNKDGSMKLPVLHIVPASVLREKEAQKEAEKKEEEEKQKEMSQSDETAPKVESNLQPTDLSGNDAEPSKTLAEPDKAKSEEIGNDTSTETKHLSQKTSETKQNETSQVSNESIPTNGESKDTEKQNSTKPVVKIYGPSLPPGFQSGVPVVGDDEGKSDLTSGESVAPETNKDVIGEQTQSYGPDLPPPYGPELPPSHCPKPSSTHDSELPKAFGPDLPPPLKRKEEKQAEQPAKKPKTEEGSECPQVLVGNIPAGTKAAEVKELFAQHGKVLNAKIMGSSKNPNAPVFSMVTLETENDVQMCIQALHKSNFKGNKIAIKRQKSKLSKEEKQKPKDEKPKDEPTPDKPIDDAKPSEIEFKTPLLPASKKKDVKSKQEVTAEVLASSQGTTSPESSPSASRTENPLHVAQAVAQEALMKLGLTPMIPTPPIENIGEVDNELAPKLRRKGTEAYELYTPEPELIMTPQERSAAIRAKIQEKLKNLKEDKDDKPKLHKPAINTGSALLKRMQSYMAAVTKAKKKGKEVPKFKKGERKSFESDARSATDAGDDEESKEHEKQDVVSPSSIDSSADTTNVTQTSSVMTPLFPCFASETPSTASSPTVPSGPQLQISQSDTKLTSTVDGNAKILTSSGITKLESISSTVPVSEIVSNTTPVISDSPTSLAASSVIYASTTVSLTTQETTATTTTVTTASSNFRGTSARMAVMEMLSASHKNPLPANINLSVPPPPTGVPEPATTSAAVVSSAAASAAATAASAADPAAYYSQGAYNSSQYQQYYGYDYSQYYGNTGQYDYSGWTKQQIQQYWAQHSNTSGKQSNAQSTAAQSSTTTTHTTSGTVTKPKKDSENPSVKKATTKKVSKKRPQPDIPLPPEPKKVKKEEEKEEDKMDIDDDKDSDSSSSDSDSSDDDSSSDDSSDDSSSDDENNEMKKWQKLAKAWAKGKNDFERGFYMGPGGMPPGFRPPFMGRPGPMGYPRFPPRFPGMGFPRGMPPHMPPGPMPMPGFRGRPPFPPRPGYPPMGGWRGPYPEGRGHYPPESDRDHFPEEERASDMPSEKSMNVPAKPQQLEPPPTSKFNFPQNPLPKPSTLPETHDKPPQEKPKFNFPANPVKKPPGLKMSAQQGPLGDGPNPRVAPLINPAPLVQEPAKPVAPPKVVPDPPRAAFSNYLRKKGILINEEGKEISPESIPSLLNIPVAPKAPSLMEISVGSETSKQTEQKVTPLLDIKPVNIAPDPGMPVSENKTAAGSGAANSEQKTHVPSLMDVNTGAIQDSNKNVNQPGKSDRNNPTKLLDSMISKNFT